MTRALLLLAALAGCGALPSRRRRRATASTRRASRAGEEADPLGPAGRLMAAGQYELALDAYLRAAARDGFTVDTLAALGTANLRLGRLGQAEALLRRGGRGGPLLRARLEQPRRPPDGAGASTARPPRPSAAPMPRTAAAATRSATISASRSPGCEDPSLYRRQRGRRGPARRVRGRERPALPSSRSNRSRGTARQAMRQPVWVALVAAATLAGCGARDGDAEVQRALNDITSVEDAGPHRDDDVGGRARARPSPTSRAPSRPTPTRIDARRGLAESLIRAGRATEGAAEWARRGRHARRHRRRPRGLGRAR